MIITELLPAMAFNLQSTEPTDEDLSALDDLLAESEARIKKVKESKKQQYTIKTTDDLPIKTWKILEYAEIWAMTKCACGAEGGKTFVRYMQKSKAVGDKSETIHWETVATLPVGCAPKMAISIKQVERCESCAKLENPIWEDFKEVVK